MSESSRYDVAGLVEAQYEPGSNERVLKNRLGITLPVEMDAFEARALQRLTHEAVGRFGEKHCFTATDICDLHKAWMGEIYAWAGCYRQVNISKGEFPFAPAAQVPVLMAQYERESLLRYTPCNFTDRRAVVSAIAETHVELVLVHPFRDGNGRIARLLSILMALQARLPLLNFSAITGDKKNAYFAAVQAGLDKNYLPMETLFSGIIQQSLAASAQ